MWIRIVTAAAVLVSGAVHLWLWFDGFRTIHLIGPAFMLNGVAGLVIAVLLLLWRHWIPLLLALGFGASTLGAYLISATVGLFGFHEVWTGTFVVTAGVAEIVAIVGALLAFRHEYAVASPRQLRHPLAARDPQSS